MADLNVQPKKRAPVWPWILLVLVIVAVAFLVLRNKGVIDNSTTTDSTTSQPADTATQYRTDTMRTDTLAR